ncbi:MAG TPA: threonine synthase [Planctomycetota bacterium]|nr:threonine synthase [Planctomycetota bacterium]
MQFVSHLESTHDGSRLPAGSLQTTHGDKPIVVRYDLAAIGRAVQRSELRARPQTMWRWRELLPFAKATDVVSLGEEWTPLLDCPRLAARCGVRKLWIKDEGHLPTGSFKARGMAMAVTMAKALGIEHLAAPTAGNAGSALAAYAARAGLRCTILMPEDTPLVNQLEAHWYGARAFLVDGLIHQCGAIVKEGAARDLWFDMSTMKEPYRLEGKKTMGLELCEQLDWQLPDVILYPTGGGTGLVGMWKAFAELRALGWLPPAARLPRMYACQAAGCAGIVQAFELGMERAVQVANAQTRAAGLRVPKAFADFMILDAVRQSGGRAVAAAEDRLQPWMREVMAGEGIALCPEAAACLEALETSRRAGHIAAHEEVVLFNTGAATKYIEVLQTELPRLRRDAVDWSLLAAR